MEIDSTVLYLVVLGLATGLAFVECYRLRRLVIRMRKGRWMVLQAQRRRFQRIEDRLAMAKSSPKLTALVRKGDGTSWRQADPLGE